MQPLKVNFTDEEAGSKVREVPPSGEYVVNITDGERKQVNPSRKNAGKPFWKIVMVIQDGNYAGNTLVSSVMLFDGALYSFAQLMKALGHDINSGDFEVPELESLFGQTIIVRGNKMPPKTLEDGTDLQERFEVKGFKPYKTGTKLKAGSNSLLP